MLDVHTPDSVELHLQADCDNCAALCCRNLRVKMFWVLTSDEVECRFLNENNRCQIYGWQGLLGFNDCSNFNCDGTGPSVTRLFNELQTAGIEEKIGPENFNDCRRETFQLSLTKMNEAQSTFNNGNLARALAIRQAVIAFLAAVGQGLIDHKQGYAPRIVRRAFYQHLTGIRS